MSMEPPDIELPDALEELSSEQRKLRAELLQFRQEVDLLIEGFFDLAEQHNRLAPEIEKLGELARPVWASQLGDEPADDFDQHVHDLVVQVRRLILVAGLTKSPGMPVHGEPDPHDLQAPVSPQNVEGPPPVRQLRRLLDAASRLMVKPNSSGGLRVYAHLLVSDDRPVFVFDIEPIGFWGTEGLWRFEEGQPMPLLDLLLWIARLCTGDTEDEP